MTFLFSLAIFLGAGLLFLAQPMVGKMVLPRLGGSPAVWNTCMVFFQAALLTGYAYAHALERVRKRSLQVGIHACILAIPVLVLPMGIPPGWEPANGASPAWSLLQLLFGVAFLPVAVLATTGPLIQRWFSKSSAIGARDPYFLYAGSNAGSFLGLLAYPFLLEPALGLSQQSKVWSAGYVIYAILVIVCGVLVTRSMNTTDIQTAAPVPSSPAYQPTASRWAQRGLWLALSLIPSSLLIGVTHHLATDVASVPLLWVMPLGLYLLTFVVAFTSIGPLCGKIAAVAFVPLAAAAGILSQRTEVLNIQSMIMLNLAALFAGALTCHAGLAATRPPTARLTEFYLFVALGGVLGGILNALIAPLVFTAVWEFPLAMAAVVAFALWPDWIGRRRWARVVPLLVVIAAGIYGQQARQASGEELYRERTFFGIHIVQSESNGSVNVLKHGTTRHGAQLTADGKRHFPTTYYHPSGPIGSIMRIGLDNAYFNQIRDTLVAKGEPAPRQPDLRRVALVGMGVGTLAAYSRAGDDYTFFEIDSAVVRIATNSELFTFISDAKGKINIVLGDGRLKLAEQPDGHFGLIVLDAFSSDAIPAHLLTKEAFEIYAKKLAPGGIIAVHISNRHVDLSPVLWTAAQQQGMFAIGWRDATVTEAQSAAVKTISVWVALAREEDDFRALDQPGTWVPLGMPSRPFRGWTDDYSNLLDVMGW